MSYNWPIITDKLYGIVKGSCKDLMMYDATGNETIDPKDATRFFATFKSDSKDLETFTILVAIHDAGQSSFINIKTPDLPNDEDFNRVYELRNHIHAAVGRREGIKVNWQVFDHAIDPKEEAVHNIKESKDVGKFFGTTKSSFQRIGNAKLILRHTDSINEEKHGARTRHIRAIFVENKAGERFAYPHMHVTGARAFARHISNGGTNHDAIAEGIFGLSEKYLQLRRSGNMIRKSTTPTNEWISGIREGMQSINGRLKKLHGPQGYSSASEVLSETSMIVDNGAISDLHARMAESCDCQQGGPGYDDLGTAAGFLSMNPQPQMQPQVQPTTMTFGWKARPDIISNADQYPHVLERLAWQLGEIAGACDDPTTSSRLSEIAMKISSGVKPTDDDMLLVREAFTSSQEYVPAVEEMLPEEAELEAFLEEYEPERIFAEDSATDYDSIVNHKYAPGIPGDIVKQEGDIYLTVYDGDKVGRNSYKQEYEVYKKIGDKFNRIENLDMPYDQGSSAVAKFNENLPRYHDWTPNTSDMEEGIFGRATDKPRGGQRNPAPGDMSLSAMADKLEKDPNDPTVRDVVDISQSYNNDDDAYDHDTTPARIRGLVISKDYDGIADILQTAAMDRQALPPEELDSIEDIEAELLNQANSGNAQAAIWHSAIINGLEYYHDAFGSTMTEWDEDPDHLDSQRADALEANIEYYLDQMGITSPMTMAQAKQHANSIEKNGSGITADETIDYMEQRGMIIPGEDDHLTESPDTGIARMKKLAGI